MDGLDLGTPVAHGGTVAGLVVAVVVQLPIAVFLQGSASVDILVDYLLGIGASRGRFGYILGVNSVVGNLVSAIRQIEVSSLGGATILLPVKAMPLISARSRSKSTEPRTLP